MQANALRAGMCVLLNNEVCSIMSVTHRTPGNLRAFVQVRMRNLKNEDTQARRAPMVTLLGVLPERPIPCA